jgi:Holliday junction resolvase-like predicted endonuclease
MIAADELVKKGYKILSKNFIFDHKEVDIVCEFNGQIVFVEVKTRTSPYLSDPCVTDPDQKTKADHQSRRSLYERILPRQRSDL